MIYVLLFLTLFLCFICSGPRLNLRPLGEGAYITRERTCLVNGFFIWMVFVCHINGYGLSLSFPDKEISYMLMKIGQCVVATFFFYSGYGLMTSIQKKGESYARTLLLHRLPTLFLHFSIAVLCYYVVAVYLGKEVTIQRLLLSFIGWQSVGNSNWFIFVTFLSYVCIAVSTLVFFRKSKWCVCFFTAVLLVLYIVLFALYSNKGCWWVDTCLCIPAGMLFSLCRERLDKWMGKLRIPTIISAVVLSGLGLYIYRHNRQLSDCIGAADIEIIWYFISNIGVCIFALGVNYVFSCISFKRKPSSFLVWSGGSALFYLYIYQRIPMLIGAHYGFQQSHLILYQLACILLTLMLAILSVFVFSRLDALIWRKK